MERLKSVKIDSASQTEKRERRNTAFMRCRAIKMAQNDHPVLRHLFAPSLAHILRCR
jgi:hypothetical protein